MITAYNLHNGKVLYKQNLVLRAKSRRAGGQVEIQNADDLKSFDQDDLERALLIDLSIYKPALSSGIWTKVATQPGVSKNGTVWYWSSDVPDDINEALAPIFKEIDEDYMARLKTLNERQTKRLIALHDFIKEH